MNEKSDKVDEVQAAQGWTDDTLLTLALRFIGLQGLDGEFDDFVAGVAADENDECASGDDDDDDDEGHEYEMEYCDECGETIPHVDGGSINNRHHRDDCSLHDPNED